MAGRPRRSDLDLIRNHKGIVDVDPKIPHSTLDLGVTQIPQDAIMATNSLISMIATRPTRRSARSTTLWSVRAGQSATSSRLAASSAWGAKGPRRPRFRHRVVQRQRKRWNAVMNTTKEQL